jgi:dGTP triphosphohydrolase
MRHPEALPLHQQENIASEGLPRAVSDYMAGMTDAYILRTYEDLLGRDLPGPASR